MPGQELSVEVNYEGVINYPVRCWAGDTRARPANRRA